MAKDDTSTHGMTGKIVQNKYAGREHVRRALYPKRGRLLEARGVLVRKKFDTGLDPDEEQELEAIRADLDAIEGAECGESLEAIADKHERLADAIRSALAWSRRLCPEDS